VQNGRKQEGPRYRVLSCLLGVFLACGAGQDFNDLLLVSGPQAVMDTINAALPKPEEAAPEIGQHRPANFLRDAKDVPIMRADEGDLAHAVEKTWTLLLASNRKPWLFCYAGIPTWVAPDN